MADLQILKQIFAMEGDSRRSLCGPRRWQGEDLVGVERFRGLRHGTSSHAKRLYHPVRLDFSLLIHAPLTRLFTIYNYSWATYSKGAFKEGVSLSVDDELNRWQKYAYGCNE